MQYCRNLKYILILICLTSCSATTTKHDNDQTAQTVTQLNNAANINIELGLHYLQQKNFQEAQKKLLLALQQSPQNFLAYDAIGYFWETIQEIPLAEKYYQQALKIAPTNGAAHNNYGTFLYREHRCQEALAQFITATHDINYLHLAAAYENAGLAAICLNTKTRAKYFFIKASLMEQNREKKREKNLKKLAPM